MRAKAVAFCLVAAGVAAAGVSAVPGAPPPAKVAACATGEIGFLGPLTGPFATIGREQLDWATLAVDRFNAANATRFTVRSGDTRLVPRLAVKVGSAFASDKSMLATVGPTGSQEVMAVGEVFTRRGLPGVLASATSVTLTGGAYPTFSRVVGSNVVQGKSDAFFMVDKLNAKKVLIVDDEEPYSTLIATSASNVLKANGVQVKRRSVSQTATDFSSLIAGMASGTDVVFLPWQVASNAELFAQQLRDQGVTTKILGSDGLDSAQFTAPGAYVSSFSRDIHGLAGAAAVIAAYEAAHGTKWGLSARRPTSPRR